MEIKDSNANLLSNHEVYSLLTEIKDQRQTGQSRLPGGFSTIVYETLKLLESSPCSVQSADIIAEFLQQISSFGLTKAEKLQLINLRPTTPVEIQLIIEECEERLTEDKVTELIDLICKYLPDKAAQTTVKSEPGE